MSSQSPNPSAQASVHKIRSRTGKACCRCRNDKVKCHRFDDLDTTPCERCSLKINKGEAVICEYMSVAEENRRKALSKQATPLREPDTPYEAHSHSYDPSNEYDIHPSSSYLQPFDSSPAPMQNWSQPFELAGSGYPATQAEHTQASSGNSQQYNVGSAHGQPASNPYPYGRPGAVGRLDQIPRIFAPHHSPFQGSDYFLADGMLNHEVQYLQPSQNVAARFEPVAGAPVEPQVQPDVGYNGY